MPRANYTPNFEEYSGVKPFRAWVQAVLPQVYDDALSYQELVYKMLSYLNTVIEDVNTAEGNIESMRTAYIKLENFVNTYFEELDVDKAIGAKLDSMAKNGTLTSLISPFIPSLVTNWLNANVTPTSPPIDKSLTIEGAGADAKSTGDKISKLMNESVSYKRVLTSADDLNNLTVSGIYMFNTGDIPANSPFENLSNVTVFSADYNTALRYVVQIVQRTGSSADQYIAIRNRNANAEGGEWSPWYYPIITCERTVTDTALAYRRILTSADDLNDLTTNGIYVFNSGNVPANSPFENLSNVTVFSADYNTTLRYVVQVVQRTGSSTDQFIAIRNRNDNAEGGEWSPWYYPVMTSERSSTDTVLAYRGILSASDDLNTITTDGIYHFPDGALPVNAPFTYGGILVVAGSNSTTSQKTQWFVGYGTEVKRGVSHREMANDTWFTWRYMPYSGTPTGYAVCGKRLSIMGDSISTFAGYVPTGDGYASYYSGSNCGVTSVNQTWWKRLIDKTGMILCVNNSVSGSSCCSGVRADRIEGSNSARTGGLADSDYNNPDIIIIYMGTNDYLSAVNQGSYDGTGDFPTDTTTFREAYSIMLDAIMSNYPMAKVYCCTMCHSASKSTTKRPVDYTTDGTLKRDWNNIIRELAQLFNCEVIDFESCGINASNISYYTGDDASAEDGVSGEGNIGRGLHPNAAGHELLYLEALKHFRSEFSV